MGNKLALTVNSRPHPYEPDHGILHWDIFNSPKFTSLISK